MRTRVQAARHAIDDAGFPRHPASSGRNDTLGAAHLCNGERRCRGRSRLVECVMVAVEGMTLCTVGAAHFCNTASATLAARSASACREFSFYRECAKQGGCHMCVWGLASWLSGMSDAPLPSSSRKTKSERVCFCKLSLGPQIASSSRECDGLRGVLPACLLPLTTLTLVFREEEGRGAPGIPVSQLASPHIHALALCFALR